MLITHIPEDLTDFFASNLQQVKKIVVPKDYNNALIRKVWWSENLVNLLQIEEFSKNIAYLKNIAEKTFHCRLKFTYIHYIDYENGGNMEFHSHKHAEDYAFILYLNDCLDGETNFHLKQIVSLLPKKSQVVFFESEIEHSGSLSNNKQVLVCGLQKVL